MLSPLETNPALAKQMEITEESRRKGAGLTDAGHAAVKQKSLFINVERPYSHRP